MSLEEEEPSTIGWKPQITKMFSFSISFSLTLHFYVLHLAVCILHLPSHPWTAEDL